MAWNPDDPESLKDYVSYVSQNEKVPTSLVFGIIKAESNWDSKARNKIGTASGLLEFLDSSFDWYCIGGYDKDGKKHGYFIAQDMSQKNNPLHTEEVGHLKEVATQLGKNGQKERE